ncbi:DUF1934 domain-containing protein [Thermoflavimicrobium dichotomicum]|uniref:Uncharacterized beta-barrel protein YwiB, DUF1934 family n=1 Tax=Thermoflavimicrobium dichotomicum TaxID=46223 RepID=A0A1I3K8H0_9BACL|nr:DUF1934 domain-containing protein [Thermoflavimicrobium dichotomicum]SFI68792.1 Uncharacterized beta-barrel protein YwiB, DUF1934 family [Thermoflavimicrobium dichotomicum]
MIPVQIQIKSVIYHEGEGEPEVIQQQAEGQLDVREDEWVLRYRENTGTEDETRTTVKSWPDYLMVIRHGAVSYRQTYRPHQTITSMVHTPAGQTEMDVTTLDYIREWKPPNGRISFSFHLTMGQEKMGRYQLTIQWIEGKENERT